MNSRTVCHWPPFPGYLRAAGRAGGGLFCCGVSTVPWSGSVCPFAMWPENWTIIGPITVSTSMGLEGLELVLDRLPDQIGTVVSRLQQSQREALRAEQLAAVGQWPRVAHELRNPLMSMKILVQAAGEGRLTTRDLAVLEEEITRLEKLPLPSWISPDPPE